ncbi:hypothetical protein I553_6086 [Mycobacterium xenopi 4042]|uniref:Uncharacterized protein n=1 Tax=Mycobacterium xenopi 4042 TaxID=1299334 RepID=X8BFH4_MYCXE|nr:hypothetical protein I553_6086 [Mycobacterium xenopi 4042]
MCKANLGTIVQRSRYPRLCPRRAAAAPRCPPDSPARPTANRTAQPSWRDCTCHQVATVTVVSLYGHE